jgi:hypothetical protein
MRLEARIHRDRAQAADRIALIEEVAANHLPIALGNDTEDGRVVDEQAGKLGSGLNGWNVRREPVVLGNAFEGFVINASARSDISGGRGSDSYIHLPSKWLVARWRPAGGVYPRGHCAVF